MGITTRLLIDSRFSLLVTGKISVQILETPLKLTNATRIIGKNVSLEQKNSRSSVRQCLEFFLTISGASNKIIFNFCASILQLSHFWVGKVRINISLP